MKSIFKKIIDGELPADKVFENDLVVAFKDIHPAAPIHILIMPKKEIPDLQSVKEEDMSLIVEVMKVAQDLAEKYSITNGYRLLTNNGPFAGQTIFHLHFHLIGGKRLGALG